MGYQRSKSMDMPPISGSDIDRFESRIERVPGVGCWIYTGQQLPNNYGYFVIKKKHIYAHRFSWMIYRGNIPDGFVVDHLCSVRECVNPSHLEPVSQKENVRRTIFRGRNRSQFSGATHCVHGHEFTEENTRRRGGRRLCRSCGRSRQKKYRLEKKHGFALNFKV